uniref:Uncharacterized protein n=1 Tax=Glossina brevipalpis TaxID=37001 RepID=A0A1A9WCR0_9MUSC
MLIITVTALPAVMIRLELTLCIAAKFLLWGIFVPVTPVLVAVVVVVVVVCKSVSMFSVLVAFMAKRLLPLEVIVDVVVIVVGVILVETVVVVRTRSPIPGPILVLLNNLMCLKGISQVGCSGIICEDCELESGLSELQVTTVLAAVAAVCVVTIMSPLSPLLSDLGDKDSSDVFIVSS